MPNMRVPGTFYVNDALKDLLFEELQQHVQRGEVGQATMQGKNKCIIELVVAVPYAVQPYAVQPYAAMQIKACCMPCSCTICM